MRVTPTHDTCVTPTHDTGVGGYYNQTYSISDLLEIRLTGPLTNGEEDYTCKEVY